MVLVFILLGIIITLLFVTIIFVLSTIKIEIKNLNISNIDINKNKVKNKYEINVSLNFLGKLPVFFIRIDNKKGKKIYEKIKLNKMPFNKMKGNIPNVKEIFELVKNLKIRLTKFYLYMNIGTENAIFTSYIVAVIASTIGIIIPHLAKDNIEKCNYRISPIYNNCNQYDIKFDGIFCIKVVHIIYSLICLIKKGNGENDERTSNRRTYAISNG